MDIDLNYLFEDESSGERIFVNLSTADYDGVDRNNMAFKVAEDVLDNPVLIGVYTADEADELGYDTW